MMLISGQQYPGPSIETCFPSTVSCTSAFLLVVALNCLAPDGHFAYLPNLAVDLKSGVWSILKNGAMEKTWQKSNRIQSSTITHKLSVCAFPGRKTLTDWLNRRASFKMPRCQDDKNTPGAPSAALVVIFPRLIVFSFATHQDAFYCRRNWRSSASDLPSLPLLVDPRAESTRRRSWSKRGSLHGQPMTLCSLPTVATEI